MTRTLKFKSCLRNCVFGCRQHNYDHKQRSYEETHKADRNPPITNFCFLRDPLRWLTAVKNANISWLLNFRIHVFLKSAVRGSLEKPRVGEIGISITLRLFRFFFNSEGNWNWFSSLVNNKKHISFFFTIRTTFWYWVIGLFFCRNKNYKDQRRGRVSRFKIKVDWVRSKQSFFNTGRDYRVCERVKRRC